MSTARGGRTGRSAERERTVYRSNRSGYSGRSSGGGRRSNRRRRNSGPDYQKIAIIGVIVLILIVLVVYVSKKFSGRDEEPTVPEVTTTQAETELEKPVFVDGVSITGLSREAAREAILKKYPWEMKVTYGDDVYEVKDLMAEKVDILLDEIYTGEPRENYVLDTSGLEDAVTQEAANMADQWDKHAKNGSISGYDKDSDSFIFEGEEDGLVIDQDKLIEDISKAIADKKFDAVIQAASGVETPEITKDTAKERYKTIATFTTNTTANGKRNTNIKLSAQALNGTVVQPGAEFSFNKTVGQRTPEKGYQAAAAYNNGEVVEEIGGGVCQLSTTLYNACIGAGLEITGRRSHTFEPSYITPGQDATVSWDQPDFRFRNNSKTAIGIRASYSNQKVTVSIYGIPILEEGVKHKLKSEKMEDTEIPAPVYEEDQTLEPGVEVTKKAGTKGSKWVTRLVVTKNGEVISEEVDHRVTYKGHAPVIARNTSGIVVPATDAESTADPSAESVSPLESDGQNILTSDPTAPTQIPSGTSAPTQAPPATQAPSTQAPATQSPPATQAPPVTPPAETEPTTQEDNVIAPNPFN